MITNDNFVKVKRFSIEFVHVFTLQAVVSPGQTLRFEESREILYLSSVASGLEKPLHVRRVACFLRGRQSLIL